MKDFKLYIGSAIDPFPAVSGNAVFIRSNGMIHYFSDGAWRKVQPISVPGVRYIVTGGIWKHIRWPGNHAFVPSFHIKCYAVESGVVNYNKELENFTLRNVNTTGFEIKVPDDCSITLIVDNILSETAL